MFDLLDAAIPAYEAAVTANKRWDATPNLHGIMGALREESFMKRVRQLDTTSTFRQVVETLHDARKALYANAQKLPHIKTVREFDDWYGRRRIAAVDVKGHIDENALAKYPMLEFVDTITVSGSYGRTNLDTLFDYIKTIDGSN